MVIVYVKHYLNSEGIQYFNNSWFPKVKAAICKQNGYVSIESHQDSKNSEQINIILKFEDWDKLNHWLKTPIHDELLDGLDPYRTRDWEVAKMEKENENAIKPSELVWEYVTPTHKNY